MSVLWNPEEGDDERVLLVVDGDNIDDSHEIDILSNDLARFSWSDVLDVLPRAITPLQRVGTSNHRSYTPIGLVTEAHMFVTVRPLVGETLQAYTRRWRLANRFFSEAGFTPHLYECSFDSLQQRRRGYDDGVIERFVRQRMGAFDTLIIISSDNDFIRLAEEWARKCVRSFIVYDPDKTSDMMRRALVPTVNVQDLLIRYPQTMSILPFTAPPVSVSNLPTSISA